MQRGDDYREGNELIPVSPPQNDIALLRLVEPINSAVPLEYSAVPTDVTEGFLVGFAETGLFLAHSGLKTIGKFKYMDCNPNYANTLCWIVGSDGVRAGAGDSGGAVISKSGTRDILTGIFVYGSGGSGVTRPGHIMWSTEIIK